MMTTDDVRRRRRHAARGVRRHRRRDGRVSIEVSPDLAHDTAATIAQAKRAVGAGGPPNVHDQDPRDEGGPARHHRDPRRRHQRQRHADLLPRALPRGHRRLPRRPREGEAGRTDIAVDPLRSPRSSSPAWTPKSTSASAAHHDWRRGARGARQGWPTRAWPTRRYEDVSPRDPRHASPAPAPTRSARCGRPRASRTRRSPTPSTSTELVAPGIVNTDAGEDARRPRFDHGVITGDTVTGGYARRTTCSTASPEARRRLRRRHPGAGGRGRRQVHRLVARPPGAPPKHLAGVEIAR